MIDDELVASRTAYLASLLPAHVRDRDAETGGLVRTLLAAAAAELSLVETDLEQLYDSWFVETAPEWVLPYLADLVGLVGLPGDLGTESGAGVSRRGVVANTVRYRQRKGTVAVLEQVVRDVTGWPTKAVEFYRLLGTTTHVNHVRRERPTFASLRGASSVELESPALARGALTRFAHTGEVRHVEPGPTGGRGRYGIPNVGLFVFPVQVYDASLAPARPVGSAWLTHPLGRPSPWFAPPTTEVEIEHLAVESDLAVPLRPRRLLDLLRQARVAAAADDDDDDPPPLPVAVRIDGSDDPLPPHRVRVCRLEDLATDTADPPQVLDGWQVMVDPVDGRVQPHVDGAPYDPAVHGSHTIHVDHASGALADVGAGTYDRSAVHERVLDADPFVALEERRDRFDAQVRVPGGPGAPGIVTLDDAVTAVTAGWDTAEPGGTRVVAVADQEDYSLTAPLALPDERRLVLVATEWTERTLLDGDVAAPVPGVYTAEGRQPRMVGDVVVLGGAGSALLLDGLVVLGDVRVGPGGLRSLTVSQCTVTGRIVVENDGTPTGRNDALEVTVVRSLVGGVELADTVPQLTVTDSVIDPELTVLDGGVAGPAVAAVGTHADIAGSTLTGSLECHVLEVTSSICDGVVTVVDRQRGCARFSYLAPGSRAPRRFRCVPAADATTEVGPAYLSRDPASPFYPALAPSTPSAIRRGGEGGAEMGVHHHLRRPLRMDAARRLVEPYVPAGMQIGIFGS
jgi:hypothetical protein